VTHTYGLPVLGPISLRRYRDDHRVDPVISSGQYPDGELPDRGWLLPSATRYGADLRACDPVGPSHLRVLAAEPILAAGAEQRAADSTGTRGIVTAAARVAPLLGVVAGRTDLPTGR
jgi:hypothetical protein